MRSLAYPFHAETLTTGLAFYLVLAFFHFTWRAAGVNIITTIVWIAFAIGVVMGCCILAVEYGMQLTAASAEGNDRPPALNSQLLRIQNGDRRFLRLAIWLALFGGAAQQLARLDLLPAAWIVLLLLVALLPAVVLNNTLYSRLGTMLSPFELGKTIARCGVTYLLVLALFSAMSGLGWLIWTGAALLYLLLFPLLLYAWFLGCHLLGACVERNREVFFPPADFKAERKALQETSEALSALNTALSAAFETLRAGNREQTCKRVRELAEVGNWTRFEKVFGYVAEWPDPAPAVNLCRAFLDSEAARKRPDLAFESLVWAVRHEAALTLPRFATVETLAARATTGAQLGAVLQLLENHAAQLHGAEREHALDLAQALAADRLKDEASYRRVLALRGIAQSCENPGI